MTTGLLNYDLIAAATSESQSRSSEREYKNYVVTIKNALEVYREVDLNVNSPTPKDFKVDPKQLSRLLISRDGRSESEKGIRTSFATLNLAALKQDFIGYNDSITTANFNFKTFSSISERRRISVILSTLLELIILIDEPEYDQYVDDPNDEKFSTFKFSFSAVESESDGDSDTSPEPEEEPEPAPSAEDSKKENDDEVTGTPYLLKNSGTNDPLPNIPLHHQRQRQRFDAPDIAIVGQQTTTDKNYAGHINNRLSAIRSGAFAIAYYDQETKLKTQFDFSLLPAIDTTMRNPGSSGSSAGVPEVKPGILVRTTMNHKKFHIPGSGPVYQNLGIDQMVMQIVGTIIGNESVYALDGRSVSSKGILIDDEAIKTASGASARAFLAKSEALYVNTQNHFLNSYLSAMQFNNLIVLSGREVELCVLGRMSDREDDVVKIRMRGFVQGIRLFVVRSDRTYYAIDFVVTKFGFNKEERIQLGIDEAPPRAASPPATEGTANSGTASGSSAPNSSNPPAVQPGAPSPSAFLPTDSSTTIAAADPNGLNGKNISHTNLIQFDPSLLASIPGMTVSPTFFNPANLEVLGNARTQKGSLLGGLAEVLNTPFSVFDPDAALDPDGDGTFTINGISGPVVFNATTGLPNSVPPSLSSSNTKTESLGIDSLIQKFKNPLDVEISLPRLYDPRGNEYRVSAAPDSSLEVFVNRQYVLSEKGVQLKNGETIRVTPPPAFQKKEVTRYLPSAYSNRSIG